MEIIEEEKIDLREESRKTRVHVLKGDRKNDGSEERRKGRV